MKHLHKFIYYILSGGEGKVSQVYKWDYDPLYHFTFRSKKNEIRVYEYKVDFKHEVIDVSDILDRPDKIYEFLDKYIVEDRR